jgi:hypothetical protein
MLIAFHYTQQLALPNFDHRLSVKPVTNLRLLKDLYRLIIEPDTKSHDSFSLTQPVLDNTNQTLQLSYPKWLKPVPYL